MECTGPVGLHFPEHRAVASRNAVKDLIVRADQEPVADYYGRRLDFVAGLKGPELLTSRARSLRSAIREVADINTPSL